MYRVLDAGAEKISIDSMAVRNPTLIQEGAAAFGSQCIVLSMQVKKQEPSEKFPSGYEIAIDGARTFTGMDALEWAKKGEQLGAGEINDIESDLDLSVRLLSAHDVYVVVGESMIGNRLNITGERIRTLRDYPNSLYFNSFDFAIMAGGYNSYHEAIAFQLPTICIPNKSTGMDDQVARAMVAGDAGAMLVVQDVNEEKLAAAIESILDPETRTRMVDASAHLGQHNGAGQLSERLLQE